MRERKTLALVLATFSALTAYAVYEHGFVGVFERCLANSATLTLSADLVIALSLISVWMWRDASARGTSVVPYMMLTLFFGSIGPLLYLLMRRDADVPARQAIRTYAPHAS